MRGEHGAAVCVVVDGSVVVDLWGGWADWSRHVPWPADGLVNVFSVGKAFAALCAARLVGDGRLEVDESVANYWPEFAAGGKGAVTVRHLLAHQAGLPAVRRRLPHDAMLDHRLMSEALAEQEPWWTPGTAHGYHTNTFGFLVGELVRRIDGRTLGTVAARGRRRAARRRRPHRPARRPPCPGGRVPLAREPRGRGRAGRVERAPS